MLIDLSLEIDQSKIPNDSPFRAMGHVGTHFDVMDAAFPLESFRTKGQVVDISHVRDREVEVGDLPETINEGGMLILHTGYMDEIGYEGKGYNLRSAELSDAAVERITEAKVKLIGVDAAGVQKPKKHVAVDNYCAERGIFIIENLRNVSELLKSEGDITMFTMPMNYVGLSGLPCRVLAEVAVA
jgi:kynurenine formamidase